MRYDNADAKHAAGEQKVMRSRWLSTFSLIGLVLIGLGTAGLVIRLLGHSFMFDPGQPSDGREPWYYLAVGVLMLVNGLATPLHPAEKPREKPGQPGEPPRVSGTPSNPREPVAATRPADSRVAE